jgi:hypothetical protein
MSGSPEALRQAHSCSALDTALHLLNHAQPPIRTNKCRYIPSSLYMQKRSALGIGQHIRILGQPSINAERCRKMRDCKKVQTNTDTLSALDMFKCMGPHSQPLTCTDTY